MRDHGAARPIVNSLVAQHSRDAAIRDAQLLAASTQARVFLVNLEGGSKPVIVKLFKEDWPDVADAVDDEFESLALMVGAFRDVEVDGWRITAPEPLLRSSAPPALVMTAVPGVTLEVLLPTLTSSERRDLARRVCEALVTYWSSAGRIVADVTLSNILVDAADRQLAFVDPGLPIPAFSCPGVPRAFAPSSRDLAYLLSHVLATNVRIGLVARRRARVRANFAVDVLQYYTSEHLTSDQLPAFFAELHGCAARYVALISVGSGPLEPWRRFVQERVKLRLAATLDELAAGL